MQSRGQPSLESRSQRENFDPPTSCLRLRCGATLMLAYPGPFEACLYKFISSSKQTVESSYRRSGRQASLDCDAIPNQSLRLFRHGMRHQTNLVGPSSTSTSFPPPPARHPRYLSRQSPVRGFISIVAVNGSSLTCTNSSPQQPLQRRHDAK